MVKLEKLKIRNIANDMTEMFHRSNKSTVCFGQKTVKYFFM